MKSDDVAGKAALPSGCHLEAGAVSLLGQAAAAARARGRLAAPSRSPLQAVDRLAPNPAAAARPQLLRALPARLWMVEIPSRHALSVEGYAPSPRAARAGSPAAAGAGSPAAAGAGARSAAARGTGASGASAASATGHSQQDWDFLDDPRLSIEEKLFRFMKLILQKSNEELEDKMKAFKSGKVGGGSAGGQGAKASGGSGGLFGLLKSVIPPLADLEKVIPKLPDIVNGAVAQLGPPLLGALVASFAPAAAPLVYRAASQLLPAALSAVSGGSGSASGAAASGGTGSSNGLSKESDERIQLMEIERLMQKTNQMFSAVSNILKASHDAAMTAVNNIR